MRDKERRGRGVKDGTKVLSSRSSSPLSLSCTEKRPGAEMRACLVVSPMLSMLLLVQALGRSSRSPAHGLDARVTRRKMDAPMSSCYLVMSQIQSPLSACRLRVVCRDACQVVEGHGEHSTRSGTERGCKAGGEVGGASCKGSGKKIRSKIPVVGAKICQSCLPMSTPQSDGTVRTRVSRVRADVYEQSW